MFPNLSLLGCTVVSALIFTQHVSAATIQIMVGNGGLVFSPNSTTAAVGDTIEYHFYTGDHNAVQGDYATPCNLGSVTNGFNSGFMRVIAPAPQGPSVFRVLINDSSPIFYYCSQISHCQSGMAGVINPPTSGNTLAAYIAAGRSTTTSGTPPAIQGGVIADSGVSGSSSASGSTAPSAVSSMSLSMPSTSTAASSPGTSAATTAATSAGQSTSAAQSSGTAATTSKASGAETDKLITSAMLVGVGMLTGTIALFMQ